MSSTDEFFMRGAFAMARRIMGNTWPNPAVGAVLVRPGDPPCVLARGSTGAGGKPHAERVALDRAGGGASGATLYVTLEPCAHHGKTPPCTDAIIGAGIARVVCPTEDPDPRVAGRGLAKLRDAGIEVLNGVLKDEGERLLRGHILRVTNGRPLVQLKLAVGSDGLVPRGGGKPVWVTGDVARAHGHLLRARADAILVGRGTVEADDPELTCRLPGMSGRSPVRAVLDSRLSLRTGSRLALTIDEASLWVICAQGADDEKVAGLGGRGIEVIPVARDEKGKLAPGAILAALAQRGVTRLLIEGGPNVAASFLSEDLVDEVFVYRGNGPAGVNGLKALGASGIEAITGSTCFAHVETRTLGSDRLSVFRRANP